MFRSSHLASLAHHARPLGATPATSRALSPSSALPLYFGKAPCPVRTVSSARLMTHANNPRAYFKFVRDRLSPASSNAQDPNQQQSSQGQDKQDNPKAIRLEALPPSPSNGLSFLLPILLVVAYFWYIQRNASQVSNFFSPQYTPVKPDKQDVRLSDVKGIDDCKEEVAEVIEFLKNRDKYRNIGAKMPKGVLLVGPPGTGKTLLAKAVANESGVNFLYSSGSEFDEVFVGVGAARIRSLFQAARKNAPCVVFIDELETLAMNRNEMYSNRQTLNQLLAELDGVTGSNDILFIGATNLVSMVDPALLRPGRFDRIINVPLPDLKGRKELIDHYLKRKRKISMNVSSQKLSNVTVGMTGADIESMINEAAIYAAKRNDNEITMEHLEYALDRTVMGVELKNRRVTDRDLTQTAVHEIGHALIPILNGSMTDIRKVTVIPRGGSVGHTSFLSLTESQFHNTKRKILLETIDRALAGIIAEEIIFGKDKVSIGASSDMYQATNIARKMVSQLGMSETVGPAVFEDSPQSPVSDKVKSAIDKEVEALVTESYDRTKALLLKHKDDLHHISEELKKKETLTGNDIRQMLGLEPVTQTDEKI